MQSQLSFPTKCSLLTVLTFTLLFLAVNVHAQEDTLSASKQLTIVKKQSGQSLVHTEPGKFKLYAKFAKNMVTGYYAIDNGGKRTEATYKRNQNTGGSTVACVVCIVVRGIPTCFQISCDDVPTPKDVKPE